MNKYERTLGRADGRARRVLAGEFELGGKEEINRRAVNEAAIRSSLDDCACLARERESFSHRGKAEREAMRENAAKLSSPS